VPVARVPLKRGTDAPSGNRTHVDRLETCNSTTKLWALKDMDRAGIGWVR
jgi:hypothetical protein